MADYNFITSRLATGGALTGVADVTQLKSDGITAVIDCCAEINDADLFTKGGMNYKWNPAVDDLQPKPTDWFAQSLDFALPLLAKPHTRLLAHCTGGVRRGPSTAYCILRAIGWTADDAEKLIHDARPNAELAYKTSADEAVATLGYA